ncbi:MAG: isochorismatase family protein [Anaerolineae bacterium]|nr:isochorismatase family protein [Anaerolineae bacterium]
MIYNSDFLNYLSDIKNTLPSLSLNEVFKKPDDSALIIIDLVEGFCSTGALASPRVKAIVPTSVELMQNAWNLGVREFLFSHDAHEPDAVEFSAFPPHCVKGTVETEIVKPIKDLSFFENIQILEKNSIATDQNTLFNDWLKKRPTLSSFVILGDCTDICVYQMAMYLRTQANANQIKRRVIIPENCVATYDMPVETARQVGAMAHDGLLIHDIFLYHMLLNGVEVVKNIK